MNTGLALIVDDCNSNRFASVRGQQAIVFFANSKLSDLMYLNICINQDIRMERTNTAECLKNIFIVRRVNL